MSISAGYHKIKTSSGNYLTLPTQTGTLTGQPANGATNQTWDFQPTGNFWTIRSVGYDLTTYAYSNGQSAASVTGNTVATQWAVIPNQGNFSIQLGSNTSIAWVVGDNGQVKLATTQLQNVAQQFTIE